MSRRELKSLGAATDPYLPAKAPLKFLEEVCAHADYPHRVRCLSQRYMAAAQAETGSVLMRQVVVVVVALTAFLLVTVARSSRWPFGRVNLQDSTAAVALFFGNVPLCPAASADCFLVSEPRR